MEAERTGGEGARPLGAAAHVHASRAGRGQGGDGSLTPLDAIVWATGFQRSLAHLDPLALRTESGGIQVAGTQLTAEPRVHLVGHGPSQSTVGADRADRGAVAALVRRLNGAPVQRERWSEACARTPVVSGHGAVRAGPTATRVLRRVGRRCLRADVRPRGPPKPEH